MEFFETALDEDILRRLIALSADWEGEGSCWGYRKNGEADIAGNRIFVARDGDQVIAYLFGGQKTSESAFDFMPAGTAYFEIEELYVAPAFRSKGIGGELFSLAERALQSEGTGYILLSTATKNYKAILHFYIDEMDMTFWNARLFKKLGGR